MKERDLQQLLDDRDLLDQKINDFLDRKILFNQKVSPSEIEGHILKAEHNLRFVRENLTLGFLDWCITGCYYSCYHAAIALIMSNGYFSKNHHATICILIRDFYKNGLSRDDMNIMINMLDYHDIMFYVESKNRREDASYSSTTKFNSEEVEKLRIKASLFVSKVKQVLKEKKAI